MMEALKMIEAVPCRCGGRVKVFGPCEFAPHSHWGVYCAEDKCDHMVTADTLEEAVHQWNQSLELVHV